MVKVDRLETLIQRVVADEIMNHVKDNVGFITITGVRVTNELSFMYVYYTVFGTEENVAKTKEALERAKGFIKNQVAVRVKMRKVPDLIFKYDDSFQQGMKVDKIIKEIK
ncbi:MAG: 30S ribosome-binding factor RbfA [Firmicutes bacterium]|nr:30S ribosome-binding factor RbfA [Bacillota bacterium]